MNLQYVKGDVLKPTLSDPNESFVLVHCVNDRGLWGAGFVLALNKTYPKVQLAYVGWHRNEISESIASKIGNYTYRTGKLELGQVQFVRISSDDQYVANLCGQRNTVKWQGIPPVRYEAIRDGLIRVRTHCLTFNTNQIVMPRMGCGLAGGNWVNVENVIVKVFKDTDISITVYDL